MKPEFTKLWNSYPTEQNPCDGAYDHQCAIRMSIALNGEGTLKISKNTYTDPLCRHGHARGAESLASHLWRTIGKPKIFTDGKQAKKDLLGKSGIIFFKDCFTRTGEKKALGDHIDLWRLGETKTYDDPANKSAQVWFWAS